MFRRIFTNTYGKTPKQGCWNNASKQFSTKKIFLEEFCTLQGMNNATKKTPIKFWAEQDRPREKMLTKGKNALTDTELLAILISSGTKSKSAIELARDILEKCNNNLNELARLNIKDLIRFEGIGQAKAIGISAAIELGGRRQSAGIRQKKKIGSSKDVFKLMRPRLGDLHHEEFWVLFMNRAQLIICERMISEGGVAGTVADPKKIFKMALDEKASSIIACHNHPSGNLIPSQADVELTRKLGQGGNFLEIPLLDHLIITNTGFYSFADKGVL